MLETISTLHRGFSGVLASLARLMIVIDSLIETGYWQFCMFDIDSSRTSLLILYPVGIFVWSGHPGLSDQPVQSGHSGSCCHPS